MTTLAFPVGLLPSKFTFGLKSNAEAFTSPLNGAIQTAFRPGSRWMATLEFAQMFLDKAALLDGFLASLDGMNGRFTLNPFNRPGTGTNCVVNGASQTGTTLNVTGAAGQQFAIGDYFAINGEFKMVTAAVTADGSGHAALSFAPALRASPPNGGTVTFNAPTLTMILAAPQYGMTRLPGPIYDTISIDCVEFF